VTPLSRVVNPLLQCSLEVRKALGAAPEAHALTEVVAALGASAAATARHADLKGHAVADGKALDLGAEGYHDAGRFVAK
jgi:hypothetical protein